MKRQEPIIRTIAGYLRVMLPVLNDDFSHNNKIVSISKSANIITVTTDLPHDLTTTDHNCFIVSGIKLLFDVSAVNIVDSNVEITTSISHNIGQDAIASIELLGFNSADGVYENKRKIIQPNNDKVYIPRTAFATDDFTGASRKIAVQVIRQAELSYNRAILKADITVIDAASFSFIVDERECGVPFVSSTATETAYLKTLANVNEVSDMLSGLRTYLPSSDEDIRQNCIFVLRQETNPVANDGAGISFEDSISICVLVNKHEYRASDHESINDIIENAIVDITNLMLQYRTMHRVKPSYVINGVTYVGDAVVELQNVETTGILRFHEIKWSINRSATFDKSDDLDLSLAYSSMNFALNGLNKQVF